MSAPEPHSFQTSQIAHVLFMDIVAYSALPTAQQHRSLEALIQAVRDTREFTRASAEDQLIRLPTGDGMALVFFGDPEAPVRCALELSRKLCNHPEIKLRIGIHTGPVYRVADINANLNVAGGGINVAQRVMDCGDSGHILVSKATADVLNEVGGWKDSLRDLGELKVKHGVRLHLFEVLKKEEAGQPQRSKKLRRIRARQIRRGMVAALLVILVAGAVSAWLIYSRNAHALSNKDTIVLSDFENKAGDPLFDDTLRQGLSVQLEQSPFLSLISDSKVNQTLKLMGHPAGDRLTPEVTREVCQRTGSKAMLAASIARLGSQYVIGLKAVNCQSGDVLAEAQAQAAGKEGVLKALDVAAVHLRSKLGESLSTVQEYATPLADATTPSLEALKAFSLGQRTRATKGATTALPFYKRAIELDPHFAEAYRTLAASYRNLNEAGLAEEYARKAYELREKVSERERFSIEAFYYQYVTGELEKAAQTFESWQQTYPRNFAPYTDLGVISFILGNYEKALNEYREALLLEPNNLNIYVGLGSTYMSLNRLAEAETALKQADDRKLEGEYLLLNRYELAFLKGDATQMERFASASIGEPGTQGFLLAAQSDTQAWFGKLKNARELTRRAMNYAENNDARETAAGDQAESALREVEAGNREEARADANSALKLAPNRDVEAMAALVLARAGDTPGAEKLATELNKTFPLDTLVQRYWLPSVRAAVAMEHKDPNRAVELLKETSAIDLGQPTAVFTVALVTVYLRGEAYLALRDGNRAAAEFQKFVDHRGVVINFPWGGLARLGLARAHALEAQSAQGSAADAACAKARASYQDFLTLWKDADPDIPLLRQAKSDYAKLQ
jgi:class 3 adenylate cyclase/tetratricopeptide (TPR) repeat protein